MRLSSISFTHASTAIFALAVAAYAAVRLAGYDAPHLPGHLALPAPPLIQRVPETGQSASRSGQRITGSVGHVTRHPDAGDGLQTRRTAEIQNPVARTTEIAVSSVTSGREGREDTPTVEETDPEQPDIAPIDEPAGDPSPSATSDDSADTPRDTTDDEEEATASNDDVANDSDDDEPDDR